MLLSVCLACIRALRELVEEELMVPGAELALSGGTIEEAAFKMTETWMNLSSAADPTPSRAKGALDSFPEGLNIEA